MNMGENELELLDKWVLAKDGRSVRSGNNPSGVFLIALDCDGFQFGEAITKNCLEDGAYMRDGRPVFMHLAAELVESIKSEGRWDV